MHHDFYNFQFLSFKPTTDNLALTLATLDCATPLSIAKLQCSCCIVQFRYCNLGDFKSKTHIAHAYVSNLPIPSLHLNVVPHTFALALPACHIPICNFQFQSPKDERLNSWQLVHVTQHYSFHSSSVNVQI